MCRAVPCCAELFLWSSALFLLRSDLTALRRLLCRANRHRLVRPEGPDNGRRDLRASALGLRV
jgi:hypothetical protein